MPVSILIGAQWGDEGKGRVADWYANQADIVARYAGGDNAGHTISIGPDTFKLHLIPAGILHPGVRCILGHGMVVNPAKLLQEISGLQQRGVAVDPAQLLLSERAHIITPAHIAIDSAREAARGGQAIGTTQRGIGPAYTDKVQRSGLLAYQMTEPESFADAIYTHIIAMNEVLTHLYHQPALNADEIATQYSDYARRLAPYITDIGAVIQQALAENQRILCEGAQGTLLDIDLGHYPYVTSSSPSVAGALSGLGFGPRAVQEVIGVAKAFSTRVGGGPMPTELLDEVGDRLRGTGENPWDEFGTTTGRARRCGWLDAVLLRYAAEVNGFTQLVLTKLDILSGFDEIKIAVGYNVDGQHLTRLPSRLEMMTRAVPIYETLPGWSEDLMPISHWEDLPATARAYIQRVGELTGCRVAWVSVGPERDQRIDCP
jgi:adenylosuccinate synthase